MDYLTISQGLFWLAAGLLGYTYLGYPALLFLITRRRQPPQPPHFTPSVSVIIVAHNKADIIGAKLKNLGKSDYPRNLLEIILVSDGSTDGTAAAARATSQVRLRVLEIPHRMGKAAGVNAGIAAAQGDVIVFSDARQQFLPDTIARLTRHFTAPGTGAVSGNLQLAGADNHAGAGLSRYWDYEKFIRFRESLLDSAIGCTGAVYAARRKLLEPLPSDTLLDDVVLPMRITRQGYRVLFDEQARAVDDQNNDAASELRRKGRTLAGNFQMLFRYPQWMLPRHNRLWWQLISHKYLRLLTPVNLIALLCAGILPTAAGSSWFRLLLGLQLAIYALGAIGLCIPHSRKTWLRLPAGMLFFGLLPLRGLWLYLTRDALASWESG